MITAIVKIVNNFKVNQSTMIINCLIFFIFYGNVWTPPESLSENNYDNLSAIIHK